MATVAGAGSWIARGLHQTTWTLGNADSGSSQSSGQLADKSVQVAGTFGGATAVIEGSNDGTNWATLVDTDGVDLSFTAAGGPKQILTNTRYIRPTTTGGAGSAVVVTLLERGGAI